TMPETALPWVKIAPGALDQALMNLVVNARDAMAGRAAACLSIAVVTRELQAHRTPLSRMPRSGAFVVITVTDNGCGIPAPTLHKIFEPFYTTKPPGKGTGLGLASVLRTVQEQDGWVEVESREGQGTTFHLFLPALPVAAEPTAVAAHW